MILSSAWVAYLPDAAKQLQTNSHLTRTRWPGDSRRWPGRTAAATWAGRRGLGRGEAGAALDEGGNRPEPPGDNGLLDNPVEIAGALVAWASSRT